VWKGRKKLFLQTISGWQAWPLLILDVTLVLVWVAGTLMRSIVV
jgi:hypothetical protein